MTDHTATKPSTIPAIIETNIMTETPVPAAPVNTGVNLSAMRLPPNYGDGAAATEVLTTPPVANQAALSVEQPNNSASPDPFDPAQFAANSSIHGNVGVVKEFVACPVRKPHKQEFVRTNPDEQYRMLAHIIVLNEERETYLVTPELAAQLPGETKLVTLCLTTSRQGALFLWPIPTPSLEGRDNGWNASARIAASKAADHWVRVMSNMSQQMYDVFTAPATLGTPVWPEKSMRDILSIAFGESFVIRDAGHPVIRRLLGRA